MGAPPGMCNRYKWWETITSKVGDQESAGCVSSKNGCGTGCPHKGVLIWPPFTRALQSGLCHSHSLIRIEFGLNLDPIQISQSYESYIDTLRYAIGIQMIFYCDNTYKISHDIISCVAMYANVLKRTRKVSFEFASIAKWQNTVLWHSAHQLIQHT